MAGHGDTEHGAMDISAHQASYGRFMGWAKWGTVVCFVLAAIVVMIIA
jgi:hypothetical protein